MQTIYMDNASSSFPKAPGVAEAMTGYLNGLGVNAARGGYATALEADREIFNLRLSLCRLFNADGPGGCILTSGATYGINMVLKGFLHSGDQVIISGLEHNAVMRPLRQIEGLDIRTLPSHDGGVVNPEDLSAMINPETKLVCTTFASNVSGAVLPISELGSICAAHAVPFVVDASQAAGHLPIDCLAMHIDALIFSAHKGLLGPQGIGAALLSSSFGKRLSPFVTGGTGTHSELDEQPSRLPDKLEAGTPNLPGVYGFMAALRFYENHGKKTAAHEQRMTDLFLCGIQSMEGVRLLGPSVSDSRIGVFALDFSRQDNSEIAIQLEQQYGILTRVGLHCAPAAHRTLHSYPDGAVRFSIGWQTTEQEIDLTLRAIHQLTAAQRGSNDNFNHCISKKNML